MKLSTLALAGAIALSAASGALAQPAAPDAPALPGHGMHRPDPAKMAEHHAERLRAALQLRPDQEPALRALVDSMKPAPGAMERRRDERGEMRDLPTPQRLDRMQARMNERQTAFARRSDAVKRFYAQLTPAQQRAFDALHDGPGGLRGGPGHGHGHDRGAERGPHEEG
jgi:Spy/CpxP family protein refolding chaperone